MRFTLDLNTALVMKYDYRLPVLVDPSHSAGRSDMVIPLAKAGLAAGLDGLLVEVHNQPRKALCDACQQLTLKQFSQLAREIRKI